MSISFSDNLFLACLICFTLAALSTVFSEMLFSEIQFNIEYIMGVTLASALASIPLVLALLGGWILFFNAGNGRMSLTPFNLIKFGVFAVWVYSVSIIIFCIWGIDGIGDFSGFGLLLGIFLVPILIALILAMLVIIFYTIIGFIALCSLAHTAKTGEIKTKFISGFAILTIIGGVFVGFSAFATVQFLFLSTLTVAASPLLSLCLLLSQGLNCAGMILLARVLLRYKDSIVIQLKNQHIFPA